MKTDRIKNLILGSIALTIGTIFISNYQEKQNREAQRWVDHTYEVIHQAIEFLSVVKDAEAGQRGYLITGDTSYLRPFFLAEKNLNWHFNDLRDLVSDNKAQGKLLDEKIKPWMDLKSKLLRKAITANDQQGQESAFAIIRTNAGKQAMDSLKFYMYILSDREHVLLRQRRGTLENVEFKIDITRYASLGFIILVSFLALISIRNKQRSNESLMDRLQIFNRHLEDLVEKRTRELEEKSAATEAINEELQTNLEELTSLHEQLHSQNTLTESALREVSDLYNFSPCGYHSADPDNFIIKINETELSWLGYSREEVVGKLRFRDLMTPESSVKLPSIISEFKEKGIIKDVEIDIIRKDGSILPVILSATAIYDEKGEFLMSRSVVFDLTERKQMERDLKAANDKMLGIMAEKNTFLAMASHDLKSPLNSMQGLLNLLKLGGETLSQDQKENLELVNGAAKNMRAMIDKLLDLNRIEQGKSMVQKKEIDLIELVMRTRVEAQSQATKKKIQIHADNIPSSCRMFSDATIIHQILDNLISNAVKFSPPEKRVFLSVTTEGDFIQIEIADEGPGIKPEETHKVFGKFQKLSARPTGGETSTGLGLSIVKQLVAALDGKISFKSEPHVKTVFTVELPLR